MELQNILLKYWGYPDFRPLQKEIIESVMEGKDCLALLPTGGGKSICFQVPAMMNNGICIVITPLIALMKDQIENLKKRGIKAVAIYSGMHSSEINAAYNTCYYGNCKFLYVSPERLANEVFLENVEKFKINLIAVDEAHCISQWGYDFRPSYLKISEFRKKFSKVPILALTATATPDVVTDIQSKLAFKAENLFQQSFERSNLTYVVIHEENKLTKLSRLLKRTYGSVIIYVRNRRKCKDISDYLNKNNFKSNYYHAGLDHKARDVRQTDWKSGRKPIMVATNAFGMGIDKEDVNLVVHLDLPDNLESYFQEAGRAGRNNKSAWAVLLYENADILQLKKNHELAYPYLNDIKNVYQALGNYFNLAVGSGKDVSFDFDIKEFSNRFKFSTLLVFNSLKFLERATYLKLNEGLMHSSKIYFSIKKEELYKFQVENPQFDKFIKFLVRSYTGVFSDFTSINEVELSNRSGVDKSRILFLLEKLQEYEVLQYVPQKIKPQIVYTCERIDKNQIHISKENYQIRKAEAKKRLQSVLDYVHITNCCRNILLLRYFGENITKRCGKCDVCKERNKLDVSELEFDSIVDILRPVLMENPKYLQELIDLIPEKNEDKILLVVRWLQDNDKIGEDEMKRMFWKQQRTLKF